MIEPSSHPTGHGLIVGDGGTAPDNESPTADGRGALVVKLSTRHARSTLTTIGGAMPPE